MYELPIASYVGGCHSNIQYLSALGVSPSEHSAPFGVNYHFTDYNNSLKWSPVTIENYLNPAFSHGTYNKNDKNIICRFALFLGRTKVVLNHPDDPIDESYMKKEALKTDQSNIARMTLRITDHDGLWCKEYNSIYVGKIELDDGTVFENGPIWAVCDFNQQLFLSYQVVDV